MKSRISSRIRRAIIGLVVTALLIATALHFDLAARLHLPKSGSTGASAAQGCSQSTTEGNGSVIQAGNKNGALKLAPIPYVLVLLGECHDYVRHHLWQYTRFNDAPVHLISGSDCSSHYADIAPTIQFHRSSEYDSYAEDFNANILPRKLPTGHVFDAHRNFELLCYSRWYIIRKFMEVHEIDRVFSADADTMIYGNVTDYIHRYHANDDLVLIWNYPLVSNSFISFTYRAIVDMMAFWKTFLTNLPKLLPNVEEHWAHNIMNDMTSSMMYGVASICLGENSPVPVKVEADMIKCADQLITYRTRAYWREVLGDGIYYILFLDALNAVFRTVALHGSVPRYIPATLGPHPSRPTFFDNNIGDWYELRFQRLEGTTTKQVLYIRDRPHLLAVDPMTASLPQWGAGSGSNVGLYPVLGLHFQDKKKGWMATYRVDPRKYCHNMTCICVSEVCAECGCY